ncbi:hypothetical protein BDK51DRAFT_46839 [Blyttiomyces helicus]|uniref:Uncharacterized protein n=1 Tax=Blyttiomyces helicus TaxID=388810 RepID=A0A4P9WL93_9FUNG|nr:hypothetical protein BDK51DRAFT_46839 [Blyttiomyces helicus]|eukprot:RKO93634.1 hypothetical protein BDK51DRAFT_46839 [Blyttiomyces helicus]
MSSATYGQPSQTAHARCRQLSAVMSSTPLSQPVQLQHALNPDWPLHMDMYLVGGGPLPHTVAWRREFLKNHPELVSPEDQEAAFWKILTEDDEIEQTVEDRNGYRTPKKARAARAPEAAVEAGEAKGVMTGAS